jgi:hypothetical protein
MYDFLKIYDYISALEFLPHFIFGILSVFITGNLVLQFSNIMRPEYGGMALEMTIGQLTLLMYVTLRLGISTTLNVMGVQWWELFLIPVILYIAAVYQKKIDRIKLQKIFLSADFCFTLFLILFLYALRVPYWFTASSDPDVHAYFSRIIFEKLIFFDVLPHSDVSMAYPLGFATLNLVWHLVTRLNSIAIVNIQPLLQVVLCAGSVLAIFEKFKFFSHSKKSFAKQISVFGFFLICWNPIFMTGHFFSEGTARLCCTSFYASIVYWIFCTKESETKIQSLLWGSFAAFSVLFCFWLNPSLGPMALLLFLGFAVFLELKLKYLLEFGFLFFACLAFMIKFDPYYHSLIFFHAPTTSPNQIHQAGPLLRPFQQWLEWPRFVKQIFDPFHFLGLQSSELHRKTITAVLIFFVGFIFLFGTKRLKKAKAAFVVLFCSTLILLIHHIWGSVLRQVVSLDSLTGSLLVNYTDKAQQITFRIFFASLLAGCFVAALPLLKVRRWPTYFTIASIYLLAVPSKEYWEKLSLSGLGIVTIQEHLLIETFSRTHNESERVLLSCRLMTTSFEKWPMPFGAVRLLGLTTPMSTAFFFGFDGQSWTTNAYQEHVMKKLDLEWAKVHDLKWIIWFDGADGISPLKSTPNLKLVGAADHIQIFEIPKN